MYAAHAQYVCKLYTPIWGFNAVHLFALTFSLIQGSYWVHDNLLFCIYC